MQKQSGRTVTEQGRKATLKANSPILIVMRRFWKARKHRSHGAERRECARKRSNGLSGRVAFEDDHEQWMLLSIEGVEENRQAEFTASKAVRVD